MEIPVSFFKTFLYVNVSNVVLLNIVYTIDDQLFIFNEEILMIQDTVFRFFVRPSYNKNMTHKKGCRFQSRLHILSSF